MFPSTPHRLGSIDVLRGAAALGVLGMHISFGLLMSLKESHRALYILGFPMFYGYTGVHLFLVISGFCIHLRYAGRGEGSPPLDYRAFWRRRIHRLYPPYVITIALCVLFLGLLPTAAYYLQNGHLLEGSPLLPYPSWKAFGFDLTTHLIMIHTFWGVTARGLYNPAMWTLALEEHLYILYAPFLGLRRRYGLGRTISGVLAFCIAWRAFGLYNP
jgi:peptidoglycan/LPS O-acetylase OafA/YrhL